MASELLTSAEAAAMLRVSQWTIRRWVREGRIPVYRAGQRGRIRIHPDDLESLRHQPA